MFLFTLFNLGGGECGAYIALHTLIHIQTHTPLLHRVY